MATSKQKKIEICKQAAERFEKAHAVVAAKYSGITVNEMNELRVQLRKADSELVIVKNRVAKIALPEEQKAFGDVLSGHTSLVYIYEDVGAGTKALTNYAKQNEKLKITGGLLDGKVIDLNAIKDISDLPSKEVLLGKILGSLTSPHRGLLYTVNGVASNLVRVIKSIAEKNSK